MNTTTPNQTIEVEWHQLELRYQHVRMHTLKRQQTLMLSIHSHGVLVPISIVSSQQPQSPWVVIDGYLRLRAAQALGHDTIQACVWELSTADALIYAYKTNKTRPWGYLEEAYLLQELMLLRQYSQAQLATLLGKSKSWVSYRLQLLHELPEFVKDAVYHGTLSIWSASRILLPFARANAEHAKQFIEYLEGHSHSSRDIQAFYEHYLRAHKNVREPMVTAPQLFFKTLELSKSKNLMSCSPEQLFETQLEKISKALTLLKSIVPAICYPQQTDEERSTFTCQLEKVLLKMTDLHHTLQRGIDAQAATHTDRATLTSSRQE